MSAPEPERIDELAHRVQVLDQRFRNLADILHDLGTRVQSATEALVAISNKTKEYADVTAEHPEMGPFQMWLAKQRYRHDLVGDLANDAEGECCQVVPVEGFREHIVSAHNASIEALDALDVAMAEYQQTR